MISKNIIIEDFLGIAVGIMVVGLLLTGGAKAVPVEEWNRTYDLGANDSASSVQQTTDGGYIIAGYKGSFGLGSSAWLLKTDSAGNEKWRKTSEINEYSDGGYNSVRQTSDGGFILAESDIDHHTNYDEYSSSLIKTDSAGNQQWSTFFDAQNNAYSVQQTADGGYILAGWKGYDYFPDAMDAWLTKTDSTGNVQWSKTFGGTAYDSAFSVQQTSDGGFVLAGDTESFGAGNRDAWLIKTDAAGNEKWRKTFGGTAFDSASSVQQTSDGGYILAGYTKSYVAGNYDVWLIKTDAFGNQQWSRTFGGPGYDRANSVQQTSDGGYILAGLTESYGASRDAWLIKTDTGGNEQWSKTFGGSGYSDSANSVQQTSDGGYIFAGDYGTLIDGDAWLVKLKPISLPKTGDINGDGKLTLVDAIYLAKYVGSFSGYKTIYADGDINADGKVTLVDAIYLAKHVGGFIGYEKIY